MKRVDLDQLCALWEQATCGLLQELTQQSYAASPLDAVDDGEQVEFFFSGDCELRVQVCAPLECRLAIAQLVAAEPPDSTEAFTAEREQMWLGALDRLIARWTSAVAGHVGLRLCLRERASGSEPSSQESRTFSAQAEDMSLSFSVTMAMLPRAEASSPEPGNVDLLLDVELQATLRFGTREMQLGEVLDLGPGDVVPLDRPVNAPVELVVGDRIVARGDVVVVDGNYGLRVTELAMPQQRLESIRCLF